MMFTSPARAGTLLPIPLAIDAAADAAKVEVQVTRLGKTWAAEIWKGTHCTTSAHYYTPPDAKFWELVAEDIATIAKETA
jgi:hypothetical protein